MAKRKSSHSNITQRQRRVGEIIRRALAESIINGELKDSEIPDVPVTVSEVVMSPDLRQATVYVLPLGGLQTEKLVSALNESKSIRRCLNRKVYLKHSPRLKFVGDTSFDKLERMHSLFNLESEKKKTAEG